MAIVMLAIAPSHAFGQTVYSTGTQGCCDILDPHYTLVAAPPGVTLGNVYSTPLACGCCGCWVNPLPDSSWIDPTGTADWGAPVGNYTYRQTFTLDRTSGAVLTGEFSSDNPSCVTLNGGPAQCTLGGEFSYLQYTPFQFTTGFQVGTNTLDFVVYNDGDPTGLEVAVDVDKKLYSFGHGPDGAGPEAGLISDAAGNLYGTTVNGGAYNGGTVFALTPREGGGWTEKKLRNFGHGTDGINPNASLLFDAAGNLYGTTYAGGSYGLGTVFKLTPNTDGTWPEKVLHSFGNGPDGKNPFAGLIWDPAGNLYGTTANGGGYDFGTVFELMPNGSGGWREKVLRNFGNATDGQTPYGSLVMDAAGNLYGTTWAGGVYGYGTVFELSPHANGNWSEKRLRHFGHDLDGRNPSASLIWDAAGNLYGTTSSGGGHGGGTVFALMPLGDGRWSEEQVHDFNSGGKDGNNPRGSLIWDAAGNLYGTTYGGGTHGYGTVFKLSPQDGGGSTESVVYSFNNDGTDGAKPCAGLIWDASGNLYSTTSSGGAYGGGMVFEITP